MNTIRRVFQARTLLLAALVLASFPSTAQTARWPRPGAIALPAGTHGGLAAAPAGEDTFQVQSPGSFPPVIARSVSPPGAGLIDPDSQSLPDEASPARLVLETKDGTTFVKSFYREEAGIVLHVSMAKKKPVRLAEAAGPQPAAGGGSPAR